MKKLLLTAALVSLTPVPALAATEQYTLDPAHTNVVWHANHFGFSTPSGKFTDVSGTLLLDEQQPDASKLEVIIKPGSVLTGIPKFDTHLKSPDFFDADKFPEARFVSTAVEVMGADTARVTGNLTLHGVTRPVALDVKLNKLAPQPMTQKKTAGFSATATIKRSDFGMNFGIPGVSDEVLLTIESEANATAQTYPGQPGAAKQ